MGNSKTNQVRFTYSVIKEVAERKAKLCSPAKRVVLKIDFRLEHVRIEQFQVRLLLFAGIAGVQHLLVVDRVEMVVLKEFHFGARIAFGLVSMKY